MNCRRLEAAGSHSPSAAGGVRGDHGDARDKDNSGVRAEAVVIRGGDVDDVASPGVREDRRVARNRRCSCAADQRRCSRSRGSSSHSQQVPLVPFPPRTPVGREKAVPPLRTRTAAFGPVTVVAGHEAQRPLASRLVQLLIDGLSPAAGKDHVSSRRHPPGRTPALEHIGRAPALERHRRRLDSRSITGTSFGTPTLAAWHD